MFLLPGYLFYKIAPFFFCVMLFSVVCSMGGLVVKQILHTAKERNFDNLVNSTIGIVSINSLSIYLKHCTFV